MPSLTRHRVFLYEGLDKRIGHRVSLPTMKEKPKVIWESSDGEYRILNRGAVACYDSGSGSTGDLLDSLLRDIESGRVELKPVVPVEVLWTSREGNWRMVEVNGTVFPQFDREEGDGWEDEDIEDTELDWYLLFFEDIQSGRVKITVEER